MIFLLERMSETAGLTLTLKIPSGWILNIFLWHVVTFSQASQRCLGHIGRKLQRPILSRCCTSSCRPQHNSLHSREPTQGHRREEVFSETDDESRGDKASCLIDSLSEEAISVSTQQAERPISFLLHPTLSHLHLPELEFFLLMKALFDN